MKNTIAIALVAAALAGCQRETGPDPLKLTGKMFVFNYRLAYATYTVTLNKTQPLPDGSIVVASFENPAGGEPLTLTRELFPKLDKVVLESPDITCVRKERPYAVTIEVKGPDGATLQKLETTVISDVDQSVMPARPLVVGPAYDKNPEVFRNGLAPTNFDTSACPT
ncbi:hypothetical protein [Sinorhizobium americanum]|uniref:Uncharacterized protein n=1 Tax=Sinorhizobium americanum TaxID=194963 RepID=A0A1L3LKC1_9HYPH|nr:hypothetical protein [Sinorhizobium americanum]APG90540.1 hypothetical protein SAMCFNEI73_Ch1226 [Sinorhizobium americanum]OAP48122.1 hypothetical protein ATC00_21715 [Sinorhizobium americanum]